MIPTYTARRRAVALALATTILSALSACGRNDAVPAPAPLGAGIFTRTFGHDVGATSALPFGGGIEDFKVQYLYAADELGGSGVVTTLRFRRGSIVLSPITCSGLTIRLGHTFVAALGTSFEANVDASSLTPVLGSTPVTIPAGAAWGWFDVPLATPFDYDGVVNLVVEVESTAPCSAFGVWASDSGRPSMGCFAGATDTDPATSQHSTTNCTLSDLRPAMKLVFTGGEALVVAGVPSLDTVGSCPLCDPTSRTQHLLLASEIDGSGPVTGLAFETASTVGAGSTFQVTIRMGHTTRTELGTSFEANYATSTVTPVAERVTFTVPAGTPANRFFWIPLTGAFAFNGRDNLVVEVQTHATSGPLAMQAVLRPGARLLGRGDSAPAGAVDGVAYRMKLRFRGAPLTLTTISGSGSPVGLGNDTFAAAVLYDSTLFGTGGRIEALGLRLSSGTTVATAPQLKIYMGTTQKTVLSPAQTYASNLDGETVVFDGPFPILAGLRRGDWVRIPLRTPFTWSPEKNLSILFTAVGVRGAPPTSRMSGPEYAAHAAWEHGTRPASTAAFPASLDDGVADLKLHLGR